MERLQPDAKHMQPHDSLDLAKEDTTFLQVGFRLLVMSLRTQFICCEI